jgi:hypothetical protein
MTSLCWEWNCLQSHGRRRLRLATIALAFVVLAPSIASAQSSVGTVRDTSGAILPGVTVEASSPALIEKSAPFYFDFRLATADLRLSTIDLRLATTLRGAVPPAGALL